jgi:hypothetical protein
MYVLIKLWLKSELKPTKNAAAEAIIETGNYPNPMINKQGQVPFKKAVMI